MPKINNCLWNWQGNVLRNDDTHLIEGIIRQKCVGNLLFILGFFSFYLRLNYLNI